MKSKINMIKSEEAVSEVLGYSLILGIVIISISLMAVSSFPILSDLKDSVYLETSLEALSMVDGRISLVAFSPNTSQPSRFELSGGKMIVSNYSDSRVIISIKNDSGVQVEIFNKSMGKLEYVIGDQKIGYENGGFFRKYPDGKTAIITPPEFHFNEGTLTFPIIRIDGSNSMSGKGVININALSKKNPVVIYPNFSTNSLNPIFDKKVNITIKSEYYEAWAQYIKERTEAEPYTDNLTQEVRVLINATGGNISYLHIVEHEVEIEFN